MNRIRYNILLLTILSVLTIIISMAGQKVLFTEPFSGIKEFDLQTCTERQLCYRDFIPPTYTASDITITPDGVLYSNSDPKSYLIQRIESYDVSNSSIDSCYFIKESLYNVPFFGGIASLTCNESGELIIISKDLLKYYPKTKSWDFIGSFPDFSDGNDPFYGNIVRAITRRSGEYYCIGGGKWDGTPGGIKNIRKLIKIDTLDPENSKVIHKFEDNILIGKLFTIRNSCDEYTTYAVYTEYKRPVRSKPLKTALAILDFDNFQFSDICILDTANNVLDIFKYNDGVAEPWTILSKDCIITVDLDLDNSSEATGKLDFADTAGCRFDSIYLADIDPEVFSKTYIDSMQIFFAGAVPDGANEYLEVSNPGGLQLQWRNPRFLTVINNTNDDFLPMEVVVRSIKYRNTSPVPTFGERKIAFVAFSGKRQSDTAYSHLVLIDDFPQAGQDTFINLCATDTPVYLDSLLSPDAERQGQWQGATTQAGVFDPAIDQSGIFRYIVTKPGCTADTALIDINVNQLPEFDLGSDTSICIGGQMVLQCEIDGAQYLWQDGSTDQNLTVSDTGTYILTVIDDEGCSFTDSIKIIYYPDTNTRAEIDSTVCNDGTFVWNNININSEGDYEYTAANKYGCDSLTILHLTYYPVTDVEIYGETMLCKGDTIILQASDMPRYLWSTGDTSAQIKVTQQGWYYITASDQNGCTATDSIYIEQIPALDIQIYTQDESCYNAQDGKISITYISGGVGTIRYYIDNTPVNNGDTLRDLSPGDYTISAIDSFGCEWSTEVSIEAAPNLWVSLGDDIIVTTTDTIISIEAENNFTTIQNIQWYIDGQLIDNDNDYYEFTPTKDTKIEVILTDDKGCTQSDTLNIRLNITEGEIEIYIPDIFSPDGDGLNDVWSISIDKAVEEIEYIAIYDRWGEQIYSKEHIPLDTYRTELWDGSYKGYKVNPGVYVYILRLKTYDGKQIVKAGDITVVR